LCFRRKALGPFLGEGDLILNEWTLLRMALSRAQWCISERQWSFFLSRRVNESSSFQGFGVQQAIVLCKNRNRESVCVEELAWKQTNRFQIFTTVV
jgi:hypothetical protein